MKRALLWMAGRPHLIPCTISAALLFCAVGHQPYGYYQALRATVFATCALLVWLAWKSKAGVPAWGFLLLGLCFNPFIPQVATRDQWRLCDLFAAAVMVAAVFAPMGEELTERTSAKAANTACAVFVGVWITLMVLAFFVFPSAPSQGRAAFPRSTIRRPR